MKAQDKISVVIPTKDRPEDLARCMESILRQILLPDEIIIVDASTQARALNYNNMFKQDKMVKIVSLHTRAGLTYQRNVGVKASTGNIVFFFDDDVILERYFIKEIMNVFNSDIKKKVAGVCGRVIRPQKQDRKSRKSAFARVRKVMHKVFANIFILTKNGDGTFRVSGFPTSYYTNNKVKKVEFLPGGLTAWRRSILQQISFDEALKGSAILEDEDFSYRVSRSYVNMYTPHAEILHNTSPIMRGNRRTRAKMRMKNRYYLFKKNIPQTFTHKIAFWWAISGLLLQLLIVRNIEAAKGLVEGLAGSIMHHSKFEPESIDNQNVAEVRTRK